jgi:hypothetical protein
MSQNKPAKGNDKIRTIVAKDPAQQPGKLKMLGGSTSDEWNDVLANQTIQTLWLSRSDDETIDRQLAAATAVLIGISPQDELEGMLAGQLIAAHNAAMECYRRAMISEQTLEGRRENLNQANKLSRTYTSLLEALNRHRGKGQQKVTVEHVHVHKGGQAVVGIVRAHRGGREKMEDQPQAKQITHEPERPMWSEDTEGERVPLTSDAEWSLPHARRKITRSSEG